MSSTRGLFTELCAEFYRLGWASGTGGGISIREGDRIFVAPSGVQKERLRPQDIFVISMDGTVLEAAEGHRISQCTPLFLEAFRRRGAGAVLHAHSINAVMVTASFTDAFRCTGLEMMKGIQDTSVHDLLEVPIIENTARECDLAESLGKAIEAWPNTQAILVRGHGVYVWGQDWAHAKTQAECYDYLFQAVMKLRELGPQPIVHKWPHTTPPTAEAVSAEMERFGYKVYDLQTVDPWFNRSRHTHDEPEIRGAVEGVFTFHFDSGPVTIEAGDILLNPGAPPHEARNHNGRPFTAYKGSISEVRKVTELGGG